MFNKEMLDAAYKRYIANPEDDDAKRLYAVLRRLEDFEKLPLEWREAIKEEVDKISPKAK